ncbi:copper amine oxidase N-terminal domain-containing protein [Paenibacillus kandeliae]|uniref:copper amine oxidase N-terminal domain-containing protein n=1 Tax=Paenibacillus kandeliae TaxID=3231269 RepID=UPI003459F158
MLKKFSILFALSMSLVLGAMAPQTYASNKPVIPTILVNNQTFKSHALISYAGYAMISFRDIFTKYDMNVTWDQSKQTVTATTKDGAKSFVLTANSNTAYINGKSYDLAQSPFVQNGVLYVNLRFISESLGATVQYQKATTTISITT